MQSILAQTLPDWELVVCDSHSEDGTWEYLVGLVADPRVHLHRVPREGLYAGWNECLRRAQGEYVYFATADDTMDASLLARLTGALERDQGCRLGFCWYDSIDSQGVVLPRPSPDPCRELALAWLRDGHLPGPAAFLAQAGLGSPIWVTMTACLFRRSLLSNTGLFRTDLGSLADLEWALAAAVQTDFAVVPEYLATYRRHQGQATAKSSRIWRIWLAIRCVRVAFARWGERLPSAWQLNRGRQQIFAPLHHRYLARLNRDLLRQSPGVFSAHLLRSMASNPRGTLGRLVRVLSRDFPDGAEYARSLIAANLAELSGGEFQRPVSPV